MCVSSQSHGISIIFSSTASLPDSKVGGENFPSNIFE